MMLLLLLLILLYQVQQLIDISDICGMNILLSGVTILRLFC